MLLGTMLALGVVWAPKLLMVRGLDASTAILALSMLWLGLAAGYVIPWWSDWARNRKLPTISGIILQLVALVCLLYLPPQGHNLHIALCLLFGFGNAAHMLAFSTASDVVEPENIGTSAAIVNGMMFIVGGIMIAARDANWSRDGCRIIAKVAGTSQHAARPLQISLIAALGALLIRETYPRKSKFSLAHSIATRSQADCCLLRLNYRCGLTGAGAARSRPTEDEWWLR